MPFMNCPQCGLSVRLRAPYLILERCPRCLARNRESVPMELSEQPTNARRTLLTAPGRRRAEGGVQPAPR
jgi:hypothetical protein